MEKEPSRSDVSISITSDCFGNIIKRTALVIKRNGALRYEKKKTGYISLNSIFGASNDIVVRADYLSGSQYS